MHTRRNFIQQLGFASIALPLHQSWFSPEHQVLESNLNQPLSDAEFWSQIRLAYSVSPNIINLNNGGVSPQPKVVQETHETYLKLANEAPSYYMWRILDQAREPLRKALAELAGCSADEIALNRNATEALDTVIFGIPLRPGDEVVLSRWDYPNMINAWKWREKRDGIKLVWVDHPEISEDEAVLAERYTRLFTAKTKVVHITHLVNWNGQVMPVARIAAAARKQGILSISDSAHSFAHLSFKIPDLGADFCGTSLHKWLCAPFGTGMLYVRRESIATLAPLFPGEKPESNDIRKFETLGTRSFPAEMAVGRALDFHDWMGSERKAERLHALKSYWTRQASQIAGVRIHTPDSARFSGAIALVSVEGWKPSEIEPVLFKNYGIHSVAIDWENLHGLRITPHVYTLESDLDRLLEGLQYVSRNKP